MEVIAQGALPGDFTKTPHPPTGQQWGRHPPLIYFKVEATFQGGRTQTPLLDDISETGVNIKWE